ncbi:RNB domain-containing ribonuclease [Acetobacter sp.]|jgi:ribonuclease R|uniref:RNB domain-containing ribonuclease n=1 Tax=Acetobacter sp. TaxID=440 RepID=UPI0025C2CCC0|nr:RNB domain-containing ribonuclease [Acetobacter sp.]MCH4090187.1 ribonuclease R [Acetobacter sp.]MCI1298881.1 ribonuclease R [Acetobacter sp.]MCI1314901.1 ribonuclease R [Acetobacter sp.]
MNADTGTPLSSGISPPDRGVLAQILRDSPTPLTAGQLLRRLGLPLDRKKQVRGVLHAMALEGAFREEALLGKLRGEPDLPLLAEIVITGHDRHGAPFGRIAAEEALGARAVAKGGQPIVFVHQPPADEPPLVAGGRLLARLRSVGANRYEARILKRQEPACFVGLFRGEEVRACDPQSACRRTVPGEERSGLKEGDLVLADDDGHILQCFGRLDDPLAVTTMGHAEYGLPEAFPADVLSETMSLLAPEAEQPSSGRKDFRSVPFVTVDGSDARDFDDAIWAERDGEGFRLLVAIADVSHYVTPHSALDAEARRRGHSVYFPDSVVPMLPPRLSENLCSLRPDEDRFCVVFDLRFSAEGVPTDTRIDRGVMRSRARLTYEQLEAMREGAQAFLHDDLGRVWIDTLYAAHEALREARHRRGCVEIADRDMLRVELDRSSGRLDVSDSRPPESRHLVESFMIAACHAGAAVLRDRGSAALFRSHADADTVADVPRLPAVYVTEPARHAGLRLDVYAHLTSPIRRYADLTNHRMLLEAMVQKSSSSWPHSTDGGNFPALAAHLTMTEARAAEAAMMTRRRLLALWLCQDRERVWCGHVTGATPDGVLVTLTETQTIGLLPVWGNADRKMHSDSSGGSEACSGAAASSADAWALFSLRKGAVVRVTVVGLSHDGFQCVFRCVGFSA